MTKQNQVALHLAGLLQIGMRNTKALLLAAAHLGAVELSFETIDRPGWTHTFVRGIENGRVVGYNVDQFNVWEAPGSGGGSGEAFIWDKGVFTALQLQNITLPAGSTITATPIGAPNDLNSGVIYGYEYYASGRNLNVGPRGFIYDIQTAQADIAPWGNLSGRVYGADGTVYVGARWDFTAFHPWSGLVFKDGQIIEAKYSTGGDTLFYGVDGDTVVGSVSGIGGVTFDIPTRQFTAFGYGFYPLAIEGGFIVGSTNHPESAGGSGAILGPDGLFTFDFPGATMTKVYGISGNQISGTYKDAAGYYHGYIATILDPDITGVIDETDSRISGLRALKFMGGTLKPTSVGATVGSDIVVLGGSTGTLDATLGSIQVTSAGSVQIQGPKLLIEGSASSEVSFNCTITGAGIIQVNSGVLRISGANSSGGLSALGGVTFIDNETGLPALGNQIDGGTVVLESGTGGTRSFTQAFSIKGSGSAGQGALILGSSGAADGVSLSGDISLSGSATLTFASLQAGATNQLSSDVGAGVAGSTLTLNALGDAVVSSAISAGVAQLSKVGTATVSLGQGFSYGGILVVGAGQLDVSRMDITPGAQMEVTDGQVRILPGASLTQQISTNIVLADRANPAATQVTYGDGTQSLAATQTGSIRLEGSTGSMKIFGSAGSVVSFSGDVLASAAADLTMDVSSLNKAKIEGGSDVNLTILKTGSGSMELASGLSGKTFAGTIFSFGGQVDVASGDSMPVGGIAVYGGDLNLKPGVADYTADILLGSSSGNRLVMRAGPGAVNLLSDVSWGGSGVVEVQAGTHTLAGTHLALATSADVELSVAADSQLRLTGEYEQGVNLAKTGDGSVVLDIAAGMAGCAGQLKLSRGSVVVQTPGSMPAGGVRMEGGSLELKGGMSSYLGQIDVAASSTATVKMSGRSESGQVRGVVLASSVTLGSDLIIDAYDTVHVASGNLNGASSAVAVRLNAGSSIILNSTWTAREVSLSGTGSFSIGSAGKIASNVNVTASELTNNGLIQGNVEIAIGTKLSGSGSYKGSVLNRGTVGPGNSPGVINVDGTFTAASASILEMEVFGAAGAGLPSGHDQIRVTGNPGAFVIQSGAEMALIKGGGFEPVRGSLFSLFSAAGGLSGTFGAISSRFNQWMLFDYKTGSLYGTALLPSENLSKYDPVNGSILWDAGVSVVTEDAVDGYVGVIDTSSAIGQAVVSLLTGSPLTSGSAAPEILVSIMQMGPSSADAVSRSILARLDEGRFAWRPVRGGMPDGWFVDYANIDSSNSTRALRSFDVATYTAGYVNVLSDMSTFVFALARSEFDGHSSRATVDGAGTSVSLAWSQMFDPRRRDLALDVGLVCSKDSFDVNRDSVFGQLSAAADSSTVSIYGRVTAGLGLSESLSLTPYIGIRHAHVSQDGVREFSDFGTITTDAISHSSTRAEAGASLNKIVKMSHGDFRFSLGVEFSSELGSTTDSADYEINTSAYKVSADIAPATVVSFLPSVSYAARSGATYSLSVPCRSGDGYDSVTLQLALTHKF